MSNPRGKWCLGHGVSGQAEALRTGHYVESHMVGDLFSTRDGDARAIKGLGRTLQPRCAICRSLIRWHDNHANAERRANDFRRQHAQRWVIKGHHLTIEAALVEMDTGGVSTAALAALLVEHVGQLCPGLCAHEQNGVIVIHTIDRVADMHLDVRDPRAPFSIENIGILCVSCNPAKRDQPWPQFIYHRRAALRAWQAAIDTPAYRRGEQGALFA